MGAGAGVGVGMLRGGGDSPSGRCKPPKQTTQAEMRTTQEEDSKIPSLGMISISCLLEDVDPIFQNSKKFRDGSSEIFGLVVSVFCSLS